MKILKFGALLASCLLVEPQLANTTEPSVKPILGGLYASGAEPIAHLQGRSSACSGVIIGERAILSAAHCARGFSGGWVDAIVAGRKYTVTRGYSGPDDLALFTTKERIRGRRFTVARGYLPSFGQMILVLGYGLPDSGILKYTYMQVVGYESPGSFIARSIDGSTTCSGDSGGPAVVNHKGRSLVVGIVSRGQASCAYGSRTSFGAPGASRGFRWLSNRLRSIAR